jgi:hypothetical protein
MRKTELKTKTELDQVEASCSGIPAKFDFWATLNMELTQLEAE